MSDNSFYVHSQHLLCRFIAANNWQFVGSVNAAVCHVSSSVSCKQAAVFEKQILLMFLFIARIAETKSGQVSYVYMKG